MFRCGADRRAACRRVVRAAGRRLLQLVPDEASVVRNLRVRGENLFPPHQHADGSAALAEIEQRFGPKFHGPLENFVAGIRRQEIKFLEGFFRIAAGHRGIGVKQGEFHAFVADRDSRQPIQGGPSLGGSVPRIQIPGGVEKCPVPIRAGAYLGDGLPFPGCRQVISGRFQGFSPVLHDGGVRCRWPRRRAGGNGQRQRDARESRNNLSG